MENLNKKIFIIDDDRFFAQLTQDFLNYKGFNKCPTYYSYSDFEDHFYLNPDLIILDYNFINNNKNGLDILKTIKMLKPQTKVIMLSNQLHLNVAIKSFKYGADDYIEKNSNCLQELEKAIAKLFDKI